MTIFSRYAIDIYKLIYLHTTIVHTTIAVKLIESFTPADEGVAFKYRPNANTTIIIQNI